jgi:capsular polysaccharide biosynthesis protein
VASELEGTRKKRYSARLSGSLGYSANTEGLKLLEPATFPEKPHKPNRKLLLLVTIVLAGWAAIGFALVREHFDDRLWTVEDLMAELTEPPLSVIPVMSNKHSRKALPPSSLLPDLRA